MATDNPYSHLNLDKSIITETIESIENIKLINVENKGDKQTHYRMLNTESNTKLLLIVHHKTSNGTTTLQPSGDIKTGQEVRKICDEIVKKSKLSNIKNVDYVTIMNKNDFDTLLKNIMKEYSNIVSNDISGGKNYKYIDKNGTGESFIINYYTKRNTLMLQGKPLKFFACVAIEIEKLGYPITKDYISKVIDVDMDDLDIDEDLSKYLPLSANKIPSEIKGVMKPSILFLKMNINAPEYSFMTFPVFRGFEFILKSILEDYGIICEHNSFSMFEKSEPLKYKLKDEFIPKITCSMVRGKIECGYNFHYKNRHTTFHLGSDVDDNRYIEKREEAVQLLTECFEIIEDLSDEIPT